MRSSSSSLRWSSSLRAALELGLHLDETVSPISSAQVLSLSAAAVELSAGGNHSKRVVSLLQAVSIPHRRSGRDPPRDPAKAGFLPRRIGAAAQAGAARRGTFSVLL